MGNKRVIGNGKVSFWDLPGTVYVKLNNPAITYILNLISKSNFLIDEKTRETLYRMKNSKKISLRFLKKLSQLLEIEKSYFGRNLVLITSTKSTDIGIKNPHLPFNFENEAGARFISSIMGDGEINNQIQVEYSNQNRELVGLVLKSAEKLFGNVDYKIYYREDKTYQLHFPKIVGLIMLKIGLKPGYKSETNYGIPEFIQESKRELKVVFLRQFFNDEGNVRLKDRRLQVKQTLKTKSNKKECKLDPYKNCHNSLLGIQKLLLDLSIVSKISLGTHRGDRADWELSVYGKENLEKFQKSVGFDLEYKNTLLKTAIESYKFPSAPRNGRINFALEKCKIVQEKKGFIDKIQLSKESKRSLKTATYYLVDLKKKGLVIEIERPRKKDGTQLPVNYILNKKAK